MANMKLMGSGMDLKMVNLMDNRLEISLVHYLVSLMW